MLGEASLAEAGLALISFSAGASCDASASLRVWTGISARMSALT
jgi:hypothetical protein